MPNNICILVTEEDSPPLHRRKSSADLAAEILERLVNAVPFDTSFIEGIPHKNREQVEAVLKENFELWADTWITPLCRQIIAKQK